MNILPKKSWHVYRRENIERVLRDEREAGKKAEQVELERLAEARAERYALLRKKIGKEVKADEQHEVTDSEGSSADVQDVKRGDTTEKGDRELMREVDGGECNASEEEPTIDEREHLARYLLGEDVVRLSREHIHWQKQ